MPTNKRFFPVIHCKSPFAQNGLNGIGHALANVKIAADKANGADGVFLVGNGLPSGDVIYIYEQVRKQYPNFFIGVNFLDISAGNINDMQNAVARCPGVNALWMDDIPSIHIPYQSGIETYAGVAFKYQKPSLDNPEIIKQCDQAISTNNNIVTSGPETGTPPSLRKIKTISDYAHAHKRIAISSGISARNIVPFLPLADDFFVNQSISEINRTQCASYFIPEKLRHLSALIHSA